MTAFRERVKHAGRKIDREGLDLIGMLETASRAPHERASAIRALTAVVGSLRDAGVPTDYTFTLEILRDALEDLDCGKIAPMVRPEKLGNEAPRHTAGEERVKTICVLMVEAGRAQGVFTTYPEAERAVSGLCDRYGMTMDHSPRTIRRWRHELRRRDLEQVLPEPTGRSVDLLTGAFYREMFETEFRGIPYEKLKKHLQVSIDRLDPR